MTSVTVVGSINIDLTSYLDRWPKIGETISVRETVTSLGGKGANQAVAAARLGANVNFIGAVGKDGFGAEAAAALRPEGVMTLLEELPDTATGLAFIDVGPDGQNMIRLSAGANGRLSPDTVSKQADILGQSRVLLLQNEIGLETSLAAARPARQAGALVIMDPAPAPEPAWPAEVLTAFDILTPNAGEAGGLLGAEPRTLADAREAADALRTLGLRGAIVTMGADGVAWSIDGSAGALPAPKVHSIDTVAAGDCFNGAFAARIAMNKPIEEAIAFAMQAAALATTRKGAAASLPRLDELEAFPVQRIA
ncbi:ribokinase [Stappia sp. BW2]|uniref:ribokinase n=1 Tax=Stappia sp. BW2 TaxID=2592622 RepID=UPI0011DE9565|nr:ribokinase [Stappia sp. BW2]TYC67065.1 ribokinase [Stappia sp. BW2]